MEFLDLAPSTDGAARPRPAVLSYRNWTQIGSSRVRRLSNGFEFFYAQHSIAARLFRRRNWRLVVNDADIVAIRRYWRDRWMVILFNGDDEIALRYDVLDDVPEAVVLPILSLDEPHLPELRRMRKRFEARRQTD
jgi:hypothetical protein